ncbi:hypothetical protein WOLCODRAFT_127202 [Wolfiporia cocos MD-104 SS10]|uniref:Uncharacterized protein n=1 Tax=Wolfiporia cocos (strain MD-104) TaxID=742152 RepID=A0A2H3J2I7_WOLCO|nr:hypothetical protein WOLCODRAFT_127202 [Wolfiporia cocos MD-104 SS10]
MTMPVGQSREVQYIKSSYYIPFPSYHIRLRNTRLPTCARDVQARASSSTANPCSNIGFNAWLHHVLGIQALDRYMVSVIQPQDWYTIRYGRSGVESTGYPPDWRRFIDGTCLTDHGMIIKRPCRILLQ